MEKNSQKKGPPLKGGPKGGVKKNTLKKVSGLIKCREVVYGSSLFHARDNLGRLKKRHWGVSCGVYLMVN